MKPQYYNFTGKQAIFYIAKRLAIAYTEIQSESAETRTLKQLERIKDWVKKDLIKSIYSNDNAKIKECSSHYYLDIWVKDRLVTFRHHKV